MSNEILQDSPDGNYPKQEFKNRVKWAVLCDVVEQGKKEIAASLGMETRQVVVDDVAWELHPDQPTRNKWQVSGYGVVVELDWCGYAYSCRMVDEDEAVLQALGPAREVEVQG